MDDQHNVNLCSALWVGLSRNWSGSSFSPIINFSLLDVWNYIVTTPEFDHKLAVNNDAICESFVRQGKMEEKTCSTALPTDTFPIPIVTQYYLFICFNPSYHSPRGCGML